MIGFWFIAATGLGTFAFLALANRSESLALNHGFLIGLPLVAMVSIAVIEPTGNLWSIALLATLVAISVTDLKTQLLPDWMTGLLIAMGLLQSGFHLPSLIGAGLCTLCALASATLAKDEGAIGSADYLLCAALAAWLGPLYALDALIIALVIFALQLILTRQRIAAFAPALSCGLVSIWFGGPIL